MTLKLRKIGNSVGTTFNQDLLRKAGFTEADELEATASAGEIRLRRADGRLTLDLNKAEVTALADGNMSSKAGLSVLAKARKLIRDS